MSKPAGCLLVLVLLVGAPCLLGVCGIIGGSGARPTSAASSNEAQSQREAPPAKPVEPKARQVALGDSFALGTFAYKIAEAQKRSTVGSGYGRKAAPEGAAFVLVSYVIRNDGQKTATVLASDMQLRDGKGRMFRTSSEAETALAMSGGGHDFLVSELQPGIAKTNTAAYMLPDDAFASGLTLIVPEKGFLGTKSVEVPLAFK